MQHELNHTVQELLGARGLEEVSRETLAGLVREYPYVALLHLLYSKKLQQAKDPRYADSVARTALYFSNPHWLHHLLRPKTSRQAVQEMEQAFAEHLQDAPPVQHEQAMPVTVGSLEGTTEVIEAEETVSETHGDVEKPAHPEFSEFEGAEPAIEEPESTEPEPGTTPEIPPAHEEQTSPELPVVESATPHALWEAPDIRTLEAAPEMPGFGLPPMNTEEAEESPSASETGSPEPLPAASPAAALPSGPLAPPADTGLIPLEPYYTIDYFASQGIQLSEEDRQDPLGRKLKRFTEWLRTMKKIHPDKSRPVSSEAQSEDTVREGAEHSNDRSEVVTEAMAEVYLKQGLAEKAIEIYRKLSLLDPSRSATFAAKIAELNTPDA